MVPAVLGRYSVRYALFALVVTAALAATLLFLIRARRTLPRVAAATGVWAERHPTVVVAVFALGFLGVAAGLILHDLIAVVAPPVPLLAGAALVQLGVAGFVGGSLSAEGRSKIAAGVALVVVSVVAAAVFAEIAVRVAPPFDGYRVLQAETRHAFDPAPGPLPGVWGPSFFSTDPMGIRGRPYAPGDRYGVLAIGGSTTECAYLDDSEAWPFLTEQILNDGGQEARFWVGNVGRSGHTVVENVLVLRHFVPQIDVDAVVVLAGINDLLRILWRPEAYDPDAVSPAVGTRYLHRTFVQRPLHDPALGRPFPSNLALFNLAELTYWRLLAGGVLAGLSVEDPAGESYTVRRRLYREATTELETAPDLGPALDRYQANLEILIAEARRQDIRIILATQPAIYGDDLSGAAEDLLWFGRIPGTDRRYSVDAMRSSLERFNARLLETCRREGAECVDLAAAVGGVEAYFYDDVHFSEAGAVAVAERLAAAIRSGR